MVLSRLKGRQVHLSLVNIKNKLLFICSNAQDISEGPVFVEIEYSAGVRQGLE
jgi:hypothetical protein